MPVAPDRGGSASSAANPTPRPDDANSVGIVQPQQFDCDHPLTLASGEVLDRFRLVYETYGELRADRSNAVLICPALTADHHAAGFHRDGDRPGWWDHYIGPGKPIDTRFFFVVCCNNLGGCSGSTGPTSINPATDKPWGHSFPRLRVRDWVASQHRLMEFLGIDCWAAVIGGSLGGMQALRWSLLYPDCLRHAVAVAAAPKLTAQNIAFNEVARRAISADPDYCDGDYLERGTKPVRGLAVARMIGHLTYMSDDAMAKKFGRDLRDGSFALGTRDDVKFQVESYLEHQGDKFAEQFDANSYLISTRVLDYFDLAREYEDDAAAAMRNAMAEFFIVAFSSDWRFPPARSRELVNALLKAGRSVSYQLIDTPFGHDTFLLPIPHFEQALAAYLRRAREGTK